MNELDTFTINFVTEGIDKLLDGMDKLTKQMDKVDMSFAKAGTKADSFFNKFVGWGSKIAGLTLGFTSLYGVIRSTVNGAQEIINLHAKADLTGHRAKEVEALGIALMKAPGNKIDSLSAGYQAAGDFFDALNKLRGDEARLSPGSALMEELNRAKTSAILATDSDQEIVRKLRKGIFNYMNTQSPEAASDSIKRLLSAAGINNEALAPLLKLSDEDFNKQMELAGLKAWRYTPEQQKEAIELDQAIKDLKIEWARMTDNLKPALIDLTNSVEKILPLLETIAGWALKQLGGTLATWGNIWKVLKGEMSLDEFTKTTEKQDDIYGGVVRSVKDIANQYFDLEETNRRGRRARKLADKFNAGEASWAEMIELRGLMQQLGTYEGQNAEYIDMAIKMTRPNVLASSGNINNKTANTTVAPVTTVNVATAEEGERIASGIVESAVQSAIGGNINYSNSF